jgi:hypothetical protein
MGMVVVAIACFGCNSRPKDIDPLARVAQIEKVLPRIRRLPLERSIPAARQSAADFRAEVKRSLAEVPQLDRHALALETLGLLDTATDLSAAMEDAYTSQAAAYYNPRTKGFFLVMAPKDASIFDAYASHELTHGLQDQHFDLTKYLDPELGADEQLARRFVVEGDASFTSMVHMVYSKTNEVELTGTQITALRSALARFDQLDATAMALSMKAQLATANITDPDILRALDAMPKIPGAVIEPLLAPYLKGASMIATVYERGRWDAVNKLYTDPPRSTREVLHPKEHLGRAPRTLALAELPADEFELVESDVLGELMWGIYFRKWKHTGEPNPEVGWAGDRYAVWRDKSSNERWLLLVTAWDTRHQAERFYEAYVSTLPERYPDRKPGTAEEVRKRIWVRLFDDRVLIITGAPENFLDNLEHR